MRIEEAGSSKGSLNCSKYPQYCNNGKKKSADELAKMRNKSSDGDILHHTKDDDATNPDFGKYIAGGLTLVAGEITMAIGGVVMASAWGEIGVGVAAAPETFGLSAVIALIHAPAELAIGGLIFSVGVGLSYFGGKTMIDSGVPAAIYNKLTQVSK